VFVQCVNTLVDLVQGPCKENQIALVNGRVIDSAVNIMAWDGNDLRRRGISPDDKRLPELNRSVLKLLLGLLEG
jgi:hypothetical protein